MSTVVSVIKFDDAGHVVESDGGICVYRQRNVLVLELPNNMIVPLVVTRYLWGYCLVLFGHTLDMKLFRSGTVFTVWAEYDLLTSDVNLTMSFGKGDSKRRFGLVARLDGSVGVRLNESCVIQYDNIEVAQWLQDNGVVKPDGAIVGEMQFVATAGMNVKAGEGSIVIKFPNGMQFPIVEHDGKLQVVKTVLPFGACDSGSLVVRIKKMSPMFVSFRLMFIRQEGITSIDGIEYDVFGVSCGGDKLKMSEVTKCLVLCQNQGWWEREE